MHQEINNIIVHSISIGKLFTKHILRLLWKMFENMFFLDSEYEEWGDTPLQNLLAFGTPSGRYRLKRLQYWIHSSSEVFQWEVTAILSDVPSSANSKDDFVAWGKTLQVHDERLAKVFLKIRESGLKLNKTECQIRKHFVRRY